MVPKRLKEAREAAGLSQEKLAELVNIDGLNIRSRLSNYEVGRFSPSFDVIVRIAKALDYPENYFYTLDDDFAEQVLQYHRSKNSESLNPFFDSQDKAKEYKASIEDALILAERLTSQLRKSIK